MKTTSYTENRTDAFDKAPRCGAKTKGSIGNRRRCPEIKGRIRCRVDGGAGGAPHGNTNALKHGETTAEAKAFKSEIRQTIQTCKKFLKEFG